MPIQSIAFSADHKSLVTNTLEYEIYWWNRGAIRGNITPAHKNNSGGRVALSTDGKLLAKESISEVILCDAAKERELRRFRIPGDRYYGWSSLVFSEDGNNLIWTGNVVTSHLAYIWDVHSGKTVRSIEEKKQLGCDGALIFAPDLQTYTLTGFDDKSFELLQSATGKLIHQFIGHESRVAPVAFSPDGMSLASGSYDKTVRIWEIATGKERQCFLGHKRRVTCLAYSPDGRTIASASDDNTIRLWDIVTGKECRRFEGHRGDVTCLAFAPDGQILVSGSEDTTALVWDLSRPQNLKRGEDSLSTKELEGFWRDLATQDAAKASRALGRMITAPRSTVSFLKSHLHPIETPDREKVEQVIADPERLRFRRALEALENIGTPEARDVLALLAHGTPPSHSNQEARASLDRLAKRASRTDELSPRSTLRHTNRDTN
jgi:WD40 repeat protein